MHQSLGRSSSRRCTSCPRSTTARSRSRPRRQSPATSARSPQPSSGSVRCYSVPDGADKRLGPIDPSLGFKPPNGVGLSIDAGVVKGGGYLYLDSKRASTPARSSWSSPKSCRSRRSGSSRHGCRTGAGLLAAGHHHRRVRDPAPARLRLHPQRRRRAARVEPDDEAGGAGGGRATGAVEASCSRRTSSPTRRRSSATCGAFFPAEEAVPGRPDGQARLGDAALVTASVGIMVEVPPGNIAILGVLKVVLPDEDAAAPRPPGQVHRRAGSRQGAALVFRLPLRVPRAFHHDRRRDGAAHRLGRRRQFMLSVGGFHPRSARRRCRSRARSASRIESSTSRSRASGSTATSR